MLEVALRAAVDADAGVRVQGVRLVANRLYQMPALTSKARHPA